MQIDAQEDIQSEIMKASLYLYHTAYQGETLA